MASIASTRPPTARRTILVAVDGSDHSKYAFKWSLDNIIRANGEDWVVLATIKGGDNKGSSYTEFKLEDQANQTDEEKAVSPFKCFMVFSFSGTIQTKKFT